ncbi:MAG: hypothetical protein ABSC62_00225 [Terracidiphilus sp.]|jgi:hypothetical protein
MATGKMKLENQAMLVNVCIFAGLAFEYFRGATFLAILIAGVLLLLVVNVIFFVRFRRAKRTP